MDIVRQSWHLLPFKFLKWRIIYIQPSMSSVLISCPWLDGRYCLGTHHWQPDMTHLQISKELPMFLLNTVSCPNHSSHFHYHWLVLPVFHLSVPGIIQFVPFCVHFVSLTKISLRPFQMNLKWIVLLYQPFVLFNHYIVFHQVENTHLLIFSLRWVHLLETFCICLFWTYAAIFSG